MATWRQMERLVELGLVRHIGTSNMTMPKLDLLLRDATIRSAERDTWFHLHAAESAAFLHTYRQTFPDYQPDPARYRFYVFRRFFEDLTGYLIEIMDSADAAHQAHNLADLQHTCFEWLWPLMHPAAGAEGAT